MKFDDMVESILEKYDSTNMSARISNGGPFRLNNKGYKRLNNFKGTRGEFGENEILPKKIGDMFWQTDGTQKDK